MKRHLTPVLALAVLAGCQSPSTPVNPHGAASQVAIVRHTQYQHWVQPPVPATPSSAVPTNSDRVSFDQEGDAVELLAALARVRGLAFSYSGVRLPLPVSLHVRDMTWENALRLVTAQTAWRASIQQMPGLLHLSFQPPEPARP
ncbi:DotD/TraH family lipoprotein [Klebsiella sp. PL-2018]|uniref:DotD/TraH family lipoprotein n=1 Tax=Klebsiella TaxID=570 RepID=UPI001C2118D3|nr:DotD/TraH family lipoprotein [Klebsiella sp. PL-2018]QXD00979.1 IncI1 plasmid conjugative transfer protein TraH [Klebsiella sp. PL-2018]